MATKTNYYFEVQDTDRICGGACYEPTPLTEFQAYSRAIRMGREFLRNTPDADMYSVDLTTGEDGEELVFMVTVVRRGRALDARVWDCCLNEAIYDSGDERIARLMKRCDKHLEAMGMATDLCRKYLCI